MRPVAVRIDALLTGVVSLLPGGRGESAIFKQPVEQAVWLSEAGIKGDEQADRKHHGGPEKALHHYPRDHYRAWLSRLQTPELLALPGAFGENISTLGMSEQDVCVGDVYSLGEAVVQVSQGRQPCWKLDVRFGQAGVARAMQQMRCTGWYYRVLTPGWASPGQHMCLLQRPEPDWPLSRLIELLFDRNVERIDEWADAAALAPLAQGWRHTFRRRADSRQIEDWAERLGES